MEKIVSLAKRRGFIYPGSDIYGGLANSWDYGPLGIELKNNIKQLWWKFFVHSRDDMYGLDSSILMNTKIWEASGHLKEFSDPLAECRKCRSRYRADKLIDSKKCPSCEGILGEPKKFNLMLKTYLGPVEDEASLTYLRPETAQGMFINFKNIIDSFHPALPFGLAQIGKAFRNEITPGNFIFKTREFEQMEIEYFIRSENWEKSFEEWLTRIKKWMEIIGLSSMNVDFREVAAKERAHYSKKTVDIDYNFPFGKEELYGLAYRTDFDLKNHSQKSGVDLSYQDENGNKFLPHVIEPTFGVDRTILAILAEAYQEDGEGKNKRIYLKLSAKLAPFKVAIFPLLANKPPLIEKAKSVYSLLKPHFFVAWDDRGNIGKRYFSQDEIGTPYCLTVDFQTLEDDTVTIRDRDTTKQERIKISNLIDYINSKIF
ncbi:MAG: glycine--tRNA ligase [Parcubacteria group bacterium]|nr:glycine--tRNA ligase [Parcubacteria group bacterium]